MSETSVVLGQILVQGAGVAPVADSGLVIQGTRVVEAGRNADLFARYPDARLVDRRQSILVPGFVNAHDHMYGVLSHGMPIHNPPATLWPFLNDYWWPCVEDGLSHENIRAATEWACFEMANSGFTTFYDCLEGTLAIPGALEVEAGVVQRRGVRGVLSFEATERRSKENGQSGLTENADFIRKWNRRDSLIRGLMCFHTTFTCSRAFIEQAVGMARDLGTRVHMHTSEGTFEPEWCLRTYGKRTIEVYDAWGVLGPHTLASQCVQILPNEIRLLADAGAGVTHMPLSNCEVGAGFAPVPEMLASRITVGLGTDGYINDPFQVMRAALLVPKARLLDANATTAQTVFRMASEDGARVLGLADVGRLEPGWAADLVVLRADLPTRAAAHNVFDQIILWRNPADVSDVMVAGRWLKSEGKVLGANQEDLRARCQEAADRLWEKCDA